MVYLTGGEEKKLRWIYHQWDDLPKGLTMKENIMLRTNCARKKHGLKLYDLPNHRYDCCNLVYILYFVYIFATHDEQLLEGWNEKCLYQWDEKSSTKHQIL